MSNVTEIGSSGAAAGWVVIRVDGKGFTKFTETHYERPYDPLFHQHMIEMAKAVLGELDMRYALVGSDEASFIAPSSGSTYFGRMPKLATVASGLATKHFIRVAHKNRSASFDAKVFVATDPKGLWGYVKQRQDSIRRNAVNDVLYAALARQGQSKRAAEKTVSGWGWGERVAHLQTLGSLFEAMTPEASWGTEVGWEIFTRKGRNPQTGVTHEYTRRKIVSLTNEGGALTLLRGVPEIYDPHLQEEPHENREFDPTSGGTVSE